VLSVDKNSKKTATLSEVGDSLSKAADRASQTLSSAINSVGGAFNRMRAWSLSTYTPSTKEGEQRDNKRTSSKVDTKSPQKKLYFDVPIEESFKECRERKIPHLIYQVMDYLTLSAMDEQGIFRISGNVKVLQELKSKFEASGTVDLSKYSAFDAAALVKMYFRNLPEPITTFKLYRSFCSVMDVPEEEERISIVKTLLEGLPAIHFEVLGKFITFLDLLSSHSSKNMMTHENLARCIAPNLVFLPEKETTVQTILEDAPKIIGLLLLILTHCKEFFPS